MDLGGTNSGVLGSDSNESSEPVAPGTVGFSLNKGISTPLNGPNRLLPSLKGVENAKKRLRAFSIQKKTPITAVQLPKATPTGTAGATVLIGKLSSVKTTPKVEDDQKKLPKPPKPGSARKNLQGYQTNSYTDLQKRTLAEIEDMKRKMELIDLGIPLGLICPNSAVNDKSMPTKAMPPIKSFLEPSKVDEIIREAKKARAEGKEFKFDYQKLLPGYDNPFQRKKDDPLAQDKEKEKDENPEKEEKYDRHYTTKGDKDRSMQRDKDKRKSDRYDGFRRYSDYRKESRDRYKERRNEKDRDKSRWEKKERDQVKSEKTADKFVDQESKETDVNLNDYLVCDSWSLDNDDKTSSPQVEDKTKLSTPARKETKSNETENKDDPKKKEEKESTPKEDSPKSITPKNIPDKVLKIDKLKPVIDSFKFEIDPIDDDIQDIFDENSKPDDYAKINSKTNFDFNQDTSMSDSFADESFLESVINEIKQEDIDNDTNDDSQDKGLVEYDSPLTDYSKGQGTPELDDSMRFSASERSDYSESYRSTDSGSKSTESGYKSTESGYKSTESGYKGTESGYKDTESGYKSTEGGYKEGRKEDGKKKEFRVSAEKELDVPIERNISKATADSLDLWNFVLKICQPLLFRHDKSKCYRQTRSAPGVWWAERVAACGCVRGRSVVTGELAAQRMPLVDRVYGCDQIPDGPAPAARDWYPPAARCLAESVTVPRARRDHRTLDREYERFMEAVWGQTAEATSASNTPVREPEPDPEPAPAPEPEPEPDRRRAKLSSEGWSQDSEAEDEPVKSKKQKERKEKTKEKSRKRKLSSSTLSTTTDEDVKRKRVKKKVMSNKKLKAKLARKKKNLKKLKEKQRKKKKQAKMEKTSEDEEVEEPKKKSKVKKTKKKQVKTKKAQKKKKVRAKPSSSSSSSSSSDSDVRRKKSKKKKKQRMEETFDVNILNNIKTEKLTDDEKGRLTDFSPRRYQMRRHDIINVKELQNDLVGVQIKQEVEERTVERMEEISEEKSLEKSEERSEERSEEQSEKKIEMTSEQRIEEMKEERIEETSQEAVRIGDFELSNQEEYSGAGGEEEVVQKMEFKEPQDLNRLTPQARTDETNISQCSSQESLCSETAASQPDQPYEKDDSHLRPSSQNSNYSFNDVIASQNVHYGKGLEGAAECEKFDYEQENYEIYEQLAMAYQSDVASNQVPLPAALGAQRIETVVLRGEIKCDWRAGDAPAAADVRTSRWGLKPGEANIVLTGAGAERRAPVYRIETLANRSDSSTGYDEAYMDMYGAMDRLQYGDCFEPAPARRATLDARISQALRHTVLGDIAMEPESQDGDEDNDKSDKGILITSAGRAPRGKRVSFADGYRPGQDSDTEEPPVKKRKKSRRTGCAWPCPAGHPDHVPLWDALPPPPPPPGSPPPPPRAAPPLHLLRPPPRAPPLQALHHSIKFDPNMSLSGFMPPEPPPGLIRFP